VASEKKTEQVKQSKCKVCGGYVYMSEQCADCSIYERRIEEQRKMERRRRAFGGGL
jgi:hypothetical protein